MKLLIPDLYVKSYLHLNLELLKEKNIQGLIIDIDNTLAAWDSKHASEETKNWLLNLVNEGFKVCLVSNNTKDRVVKFNEELKLPAIHRAVKPRKASFIKAMGIMGTTVKNTAVLGDQVFTDVLGGNRMKLFTILVVPIRSKEHPWTAIARKAERFVLKKISKK